MLTILGYSINSTIVIFDRIRENLPAMQGESLRTVVNASITQTLTRTLYSSLTTFITIFVLFLMGVPAVRSLPCPLSWESSAAPTHRYALPAPSGMS